MSWTSKYRPNAFSDVVGNKAAVTGFKRSLKGDTSAFLLSGPPGTGKTTLARIGAKSRRAHEVLEINSANRTGVDAARELEARVRYAPIGGGTRAVILDECHQLSAAAWNSLLKIVEEPPPHLTWFFCTTAPTKVIKAIQSRSTPVTLKPIPRRTLVTLLTEIVEEEGLSEEAETDLIPLMQLAAEHAEGSARDAIKNMELIWDSDLDQAEEMLSSQASDPKVVALARAMQAGAGVFELLKITRTIEVPAETIRRIVLAWFTKTIHNPKLQDRSVAVLNAFSEPYPTPELVHVYLSIASLCKI